MDSSRINNIIRIPVSLTSSFFKAWLTFLSPFHELSPREMDVAAAFLYKRFELSKSISDNNLLDKIVMNEDTKAEVREICNMSSAHFLVVIGKLRKIKFIVDNRINYKFIPKNLNKNAKSFLLLFYFDFDDLSK